MNYPDNILLQAEKPARYSGGEINAIYKDKNSIKFRFGLCFPDVYEVGMSWSGLNILYYQLNERKDSWCERAFSPWVDMEKLLRENDLPLLALESGDPLNKLDMLGFTLQHEMSYSNLLNMLDLSKIPLLSKERGEGFPIICAGGPCACNPEPMADFIDFFYIGESETYLGEIAAIYIKNKESNATKDDFLESIVNIPGTYVPKFYDVKYNSDGTISSVTPNNNKAPTTVRKTIAKNLDNMFVPNKQIVPSLEVVHDRISLEIFRGCLRGCRFCQAGYIYRPQREKSPDCIVENAKNILDNTGHDEISLLSLSTGDYSNFKELSEKTLNIDPHTSLSLPSLRIDAFSLELMGKIAGERKSGLTFAPEAGSQRLRDIINKNLTEEEILEGCKLAFSGGWNKVKLYFMMGLPFETNDDIIAIARLGEKIVESYYTLPKEQRRKELSINISVSCFVPKPHTPFQFVAQDSFEKLTEKQILLKKSIRKKQIKYSYHNADISSLEGAISRGDRRIGRVILQAFLDGARFDSWSEHFKFDIWQNAFLKAGLDMTFYSQRKRSYDEIMPWDHIHTGTSKNFLIDEMEKSRMGETTPDCRTKCSNCGANVFVGNFTEGSCVCFE